MDVNFQFSMINFQLNFKIAFENWLIENLLKIVN